MPGLGVARVGDVAGGPVLNGANTVKCNGLPVAQLGSVVGPHGNAPHNGSTIVVGSNTVKAEGLPVARFGDIASCGHALASTSTNVTCG